MRYAAYLVMFFAFMSPSMAETLVGVAWKLPPILPNIPISKPEVLVDLPKDYVLRLVRSLVSNDKNIVVEYSVEREGETLPESYKFMGGDRDVITFGKKVSVVVRKLSATGPSPVIEGAVTAYYP